MNERLVQVQHNLIAHHDNNPFFKRGMELYGETGERSAWLGGFAVQEALGAFGHALGKGLRKGGGGETVQHRAGHLIHEREGVFSLLKSLAYIITSNTPQNSLQYKHRNNPISKHVTLLKNKTQNP